METPEQIAAELAASQVVVQEDEVRAAVIAEYGFDEVDDAERIDKLVAKEVENSKKLSSAIGQKIKHRTDAEALRNDPRLKVAEVPPVAKPATEDVGKVVTEQLEKRDLESLEYSDELKKEIQRIATITGVSIKQAARDPYIVAKIADYEKEQDNDEATTTRKNRSGGSKNYTFESPPEVDMSTPEGRAKWDEYKTAMIKAGN